jgi:spermidine synthase
MTSSTRGRGSERGSRRGKGGADSGRKATVRPIGRAADIGDSRYLPFILLLFVGSGCAALIYEIVWYQSLELIVGSNAMSIGVVLGTFMGGMCAGSLLLPRFVKRDVHPLRAYAAFEALIAVCGLLILFVLPHAGGLYTTFGGSGFIGLVLRGFFCAICLLAPTVLMGATLPAVARWVQSTPRGVSWLGFFYGGNIAGAVIGCLFAGFYLLRLYDNAAATYVAMALNVAVALAALLLARVTAYVPLADAPETTDAEARHLDIPVLVTIALSGATALGAEVVWTRLLTLLLGATTYTFSLILASVLVGLGLGSSAGAFFARTVREPRRALGFCQVGIVVCIAWAAWCETRALPYWPINPSLSTTAWLQFQIDFVRCLLTVLPASILWGASFPLALAAAAPDERDAGRLFLVGSIGTQQSQRVLMALSALAALIMLVPARTSAPAEDESEPWGLRGVAVGAGTLWMTALLAASVIPVPAILVGYGRFAATWMTSHGDFIFVGEGTNSSMAVSRMPSGYLNYHNAGKVQASSEPQDMRLQRMLGHLTTLLPAQAKSVLVIGCGAGVTAGAVSISPAVEKLTIAEIEPMVPATVSTYFADYNYNVVKNPKTHIAIDDGRHFLLTSREKFDAITSDPFDPWVKGAATLYSREFWEIAKDHLNPGGVVTVWVQLYENSEAAVKSSMATFFEAFPDGAVFGNTFNGQGYDMVLVGQKGAFHINLDSVEARLARPEYAIVRQSLVETGFDSGVGLFSTFAGRAADLKGYLADAQVNRDRNLRLQYLAGFSLNQYDQAKIYTNVLANGHWVDGMFTGSPDKVAFLRSKVAVR